MDPRVIRLALLAHHYRGDWSWTDADLTTAQQRLDAWSEAVALPAGAPTDALVTGVLAALAEDLDAATALALVDRWAEQTRSGDAPQDGAGDVVRRLVDAALGVDL